MSWIVVSLVMVAFSGLLLVWRTRRAQSLALRVTSQHAINERCADAPEAAERVAEVPLEHSAAQTGLTGERIDQERQRETYEREQRMRELERAEHELRRSHGALPELRVRGAPAHGGEREARDGYSPRNLADALVALGLDKDPVRFRAGAGRTLLMGAETTVRFVAYAPRDERHIGGLLRGVAEGAEARAECSETRWANGTRASVSCAGEHLSVTPETQDFTWEGHCVCLDFDIRTSPSAPRGGNTRVKFDVLVDGFVVGRLRIELAFAESTRSEDRHEVDVEAARTAFASYASQDRARVLDRVASVRVAAGLDVWLDCVNLRPNDRWRELLAPEIERRDLFLLFWSSHAARSNWVDWEWHTALGTKGLDAIQLHSLENITGPPELQEIHARDPLMDIRSAASTQRSS